MEHYVVTSKKGNGYNLRHINTNKSLFLHADFIIVSKFLTPDYENDMIESLDETSIGT